MALETPSKVGANGARMLAFAHSAHVTASPFFGATAAVPWYTGRDKSVANPPIVSIRAARAADLPAIVAIYNAAIPGRMATADTEPVTVAQREPWFREFDPLRRPLWVHCSNDDVAQAWLSLRSFYGRPAYQATVEVAAYTAPEARRRGLAQALLRHAIAAAPGLGIRTLLAFVFAHNAPSLALFERHGFARWGLLPRVAELDGIERDLAILGRGLADGR
jgi:phosphinothricin acetyltransferase